MKRVSNTIEINRAVVQTPTFQECLRQRNCLINFFEKWFFTNVIKSRNKFIFKLSWDVSDRLSSILRKSGINKALKLFIISIENV